MLSVSKPTSLIQQKKQQWAREREEMSQLYLPWGTGKRYSSRLEVRNQFASNLEIHKHSSYEYPEPEQRLRSPSLPPIRHIETDSRSNEESRATVLNRNIPSAKRFSFYDEDCEGDTSGYGSETVNHMNRNRTEVSDANRNPVVAWQQQDSNDIKREKVVSNAMPGTSEGPWSARSPRTAEEGRPRWGDRGVATGKLWEPTAATARLPQMPNQNKCTPSWVERGLNMIKNTSEVLVIDQRSSSNSTGVDYDRSSCNGSDEGRTFLRGQNIPLEPEIKAQRENKRLKALELQSIILNQLEDREKRRQEEKDQQMRDERLEELRIQRQQDEDRKRLQAEKERHEERQLLEQRKLETLKKALEDAERKAKLEKEKRFMSLKKSLQPNIITDPEEEVEHDATQETPHHHIEPASPIKSNTTHEAPSARSQKKECSSYQTTEFNSPRSSVYGNLNLFIHSVPPLALADNKFNIVPIGINDNGEILSQTNGLQLAVLVPQSLVNNIYSVSLDSLNVPANVNNILTPNKYRSVKVKDASTQTDESIIRNVTDKIVDTEEFERNIDKEYSNIDENAPLDTHHNILKKDRKFRSEDRFKKELETRPKWGVNRPAAQYKKQSEKDPFYSQKRKIRQKHRPQARQYLSQSSDDSRSPSPLTRSEKTAENINKYRNSLSQSYWRSKRLIQDLNKNSNVSEPINNPQVEFNSCEIPITEYNENKSSPNISATKRITLSQKFINDKYGNRKFWTEEDSERNSKSNVYDVENRKKIIDQINTDDLFDKKKDEAPMLDLSKTVINTADEYRAVLDKVPDFKTRPEKVRPEDVKIKDRKEDQKTKTPRKEIKAYEKLGTRGYEEKHFTFMDPIPIEMRCLQFEDLCSVPIEWRMLTSIRPKSKLDEEYFNRLIELRKSELRTNVRDKREYAKNPMIRKTKNRSGVTETRIVSCSECGEEYCNGKMCIITNYDIFARLKVVVEAKTSRAQTLPAATQGAGKLRRMRKRIRRKPRSKSAAPIPFKSLIKSGAKSDSEV